MAFVRRVRVDVTTDGAGAATVYSESVSGLLSHIVYVKGTIGSTPTFTVTNETTGESLWTEANVSASAVRAPRMPTHNQSGVAALYAAGGTAVNDMIGLANDRVKIVVSGGGATATGTFYVYLR
jgi:hypothetical protein